MKYTKLLAMVAVALMLSVPLAIFAASDGDSSAAGFTVKDGSSSIYFKNDKTMNKEKIDSLFTPGSPFHKEISSLMMDATGFDQRIFSGARPSMGELEIRSIEMGYASVAKDNVLTTDEIRKVKCDISISGSPSTDMPFDEIFSATVDASKAGPAFEQYFGVKAVKNTDFVTISVSIEVEVANRDVFTFQNISDSSLVIKSHEISVAKNVKIENGSFSISSIADKAMKFSAKENGTVKSSVDYNISKDAKSSDPLSDIKTSLEFNSDRVYKYKTDKDENDFAMKVTDDMKKTYRDALKEVADTQKGVAINKAIDVLSGDDKGLAGDPTLNIVQTADVTNRTVSSEYLGVTPDELKKEGFTVSDKYDDVKNAVSAMIEPSKKSPVLFIVIAVVAVIVVAGAVLVVMKKKSA